MRPPHRRLLSNIQTLARHGRIVFRFISTPPLLGGLGELRYLPTFFCYIAGVMFTSSLRWIPATGSSTGIERDSPARDRTTCATRCTGPRRPRR